MFRAFRFVGFPVCSPRSVFLYLNRDVFLLRILRPLAPHLAFVFCQRPRAEWYKERLALESLGRMDGHDLDGIRLCRRYRLVAQKVIPVLQKFLSVRSVFRYIGSYVVQQAVDIRNVLRRLVAEQQPHNGLRHFVQREAFVDGVQFVAYIRLPGGQFHKVSRHGVFVLDIAQGVDNSQHRFGLFEHKRVARHKTGLVQFRVAVFVGQDVFLKIARHTHRLLVLANKNQHISRPYAFAYQFFHSAEHIGHNALVNRFLFLVRRREHPHTHIALRVAVVVVVAQPWLLVVLVV